MMRNAIFKRELLGAEARIKFSSEVYKARKKKGWTQTILARKVGTTQRIISQIEDGGYECGIGLAHRICVKLEIKFTI